MSLSEYCDALYAALGPRKLTKAQAYTVMAIFVSGKGNIVARAIAAIEGK